MRVDRLQQISEADAAAEGVLSKPMKASGQGRRLWQADAEGREFCDSARDAFAHGWDDLHREHPGAAWKDDPWVLALTFLPPEVANG